MLKMIGLALASAAVAVSPAAAGGPPDLARGETVFQHWCATCHDPGPGHPGTQALALKYGGAVPDTLADRTDLSPPAIKYFVRHGVSTMPFFRKTEISDPELQDLALWLSRNNKK